MSENKKVKEAKSKVDDFMLEDEARELAELREKWQLDYDSSISYATKKGYEEGHAAGIADGHAEGIEKGRAEGYAEARAEERVKSQEIIRNIAKKLLQKNSDVQEVIEITGLDESEILKIKNKK